MKKPSMQQLLEAVINSIYDGVIVTDPDGKVIMYNDALAKLEELNPEKVVGQHLSEVYSVTASTSKHLQVGKTGEPDLDSYKTFFTNEGKQVNIVADTYPVYDEKGNMLAVYSVCRNLTKIRQLLNKTLELQEQRQTEQDSPYSFTKDDKYDDGRGSAKYRFINILGSSTVIKDVIAAAKKAARTDCAVLIYGETGTGKELFVQGMHNYSSGKNEPFVAINCAAIPESLLESMLFGTTKGAFTGAVETPGLFEQAGSGTLFLDEINSMGVNLQAKLLRVLQERSYRRVGGKQELPVNCRIFSSTNQEPWECIESGTLRKDLFYRLAVISLYIPPLRDRQSDINELLDSFIDKYSKIYGHKKVEMCSSLRSRLTSYSWPGNVRELEHVVENAISLLDQGANLTVKYLPPYLQKKLFADGELDKTSPSLAGESSVETENVNDEQKRQPQMKLGDILLAAEHNAITQALAEHQGNISRSAIALGISRQNLQYRIKKLDISGG
ncbi:MAG: sigma 54-interacting transcriptional regulator [Bacillota bacterium]|nr:sigma 54-interacting transcriptional regulator [Bacillota bacterium]